MDTSKSVDEARTPTRADLSESGHLRQQRSLEEPNTWRRPDTCAPECECVTCITYGLIAFYVFESDTQTETFS